MLLYILLIIIAIGVLLASGAGQKLLGCLIGSGIIVVGLGIIVGILILGIAVVFSYKEMFKNAFATNAFAYLVIIVAIIGVIAIIIDIIKNKIEMKELDKKIKQNKTDFEEKE